MLFSITAKTNRAENIPFMPLKQKHFFAKLSRYITVFKKIVKGIKCRGGQTDLEPSQKARLTIQSVKTEPDLKIRIKNKQRK